MGGGGEILLQESYFKSYLSAGIFLLLCTKIVLSHNLLKIFFLVKVPLQDFFLGKAHPVGLFPTVCPLPIDVNKMDTSA